MLKAYAITVREILEKTICVEALSLDEAIDKVASAYSNEEIILEAETIVDTEFVPSCYAGKDGIISESEIKFYEDEQWIAMDEAEKDKELWKQAKLLAEAMYVEDDNGDWAEADKYEREDYIFAAYDKLKGEQK